MSDVVQRAKTALEGTTEGPWDVVPGAWGNVWHFSDDPGAPPLIVRMGGMKQPDAEFIAQARTLVPELVAEVEARERVIDANEKLMRELRELRAAIERVRQLAHNPETYSGTGVVTVTPRRILAALEDLS